MKRQEGTALALSALMLTAILTSLIITASAESTEESSNFTTPVSADRFSPGWKDSRYVDSDNEQKDIRLYYPSAQPGEDEPIDCAWAPYPWLAFHADDGEGFDDYSWLGEGLAKAGYFVVIIGDERGGDEAYQGILDHVQLIESIGFINLTGNPNRGPAGAQGCIDMDHWGVSGHGRGAGLAMVVSSYWGAVFNSGQYEPPRALFGVGLDIDDIGENVQAIGLANPAHSLFLTGTVDNVAPIDEHVKPLLQQWNGGWQLLEVVGANHVQYEDDQSFLDNLFDGDATMSESEQQQHAINKITPFLDLTLKGEDEIWYAASSRENDPDQPSDGNSYLSENLDANQFYLVDLEETLLDAPAGRYAPVVFYDYQTNNTVLSAGWSEGNFSDMWALDLNDTAEWESTGSGPNSIGTNTFASDGIASGLMVGQSYTGDPTMWSWNGYSTSWTPYSEGVRPSGMSSQAMVWDSRSQRYISYGGQEADSGNYTNETWAFNPGNAVWQNLSAVNSPRGISNPAMFFSDGWNRTILFGGYDSGKNLSNETWMFNGETNTWSKLSLPGSFPTGRAGMATAIDREEQVAYIFGGIAKNQFDSGIDYSNELWKLDLAQLTWTKMPSWGIDAMWLSGMTVDKSNNKLVLFGGMNDDVFDQTWLYDLTEEEWELHASSSAITSTDVIHISATVSERDLDSPPSSLEINCRVVGQSSWTAGNWNAVNDTATCDLSPFSLEPGFHTAEMKVSNDGQQASVKITFERANAPPQLENPMPYFIIDEEGELIINASELATDVDGHELRFIDNEFTFSPLNEGDSEPELNYILQNDRRAVKLVDLADWTERRGDTWYTICGEIRDESTPGNPPARVPFCFELMHQSIDDPFVVLEHPTFTMTEDQNSTIFDLAQYVTDEELDAVAIHWDTQLDYYDMDSDSYGENIIVTGILEEADSVSPYTSSVMVEPTEHWHGEEEISFCMHHYEGGNTLANANCVWLNVTFIVAPVADPPLFNISQITLQEDTIKDVPLSEIVWDPDGEELNITLESGESNITLEFWHEQLRISPQPDWFGRAIAWTLVATDGTESIRQPMRIIVEEVDDETIVEWQRPVDIIENMTSLRLDISDVDNDGPWLIEYSWNDGDWKGITPSCAEESVNRFECQADLLAHELSYGDHKLNLRVNDGTSTSEESTYWVEKADPNDTGLSSGGSTSGLSGLAFIIAGVFLLLGGGALILTMMKRNENT